MLRYDASRISINVFFERGLLYSLNPIRCCRDVDPTWMEVGVVFHIEDVEDLS